MEDASRSDQADRLSAREEVARRGRLIGRISEAIGAVDWEKMARVERAAWLEHAVDWDEFDAAERFDAIENVLAGKGRSAWLEGVATRAERDAREDAIWAEAARRGNGSPSSEPYIRRGWIEAALEDIAQLRRTEDFVRLDDGHVVSERLEGPDGEFARIGAWDRLEERDRLAAVMTSDATEMLGYDDMKALLKRHIDLARVPRDEQRRWLGEVYHEAAAGGTAMADSWERRERDDAVDRLVADFRARIGGLIREGVPDFPPLGNTLPWEQATEERKLANIVWESMSLHPFPGRPGVIAVPGAVALEAVERHVDYAGLPAVQRELLTELRSRLDAGQFAGPPPGHKDPVADGLGRAVGIVDLEEMLASWKEDGDRPWAARPEAEKVRVIVDHALETAAPGAYTLAVVEREVDYAGLPTWRREALEGLRARIDGGEFDGVGRGFLDPDDRLDRALRLAELEARVEDEKRLGAPDRDGKRWPWGELTEEQKLGEIEMEIAELHLGTEPKAYEVAAREVDLARVPEARRRAFEESRQEAGLEVSPSPTEPDGPRGTRTADSRAGMNSPEGLKLQSLVLEMPERADPALRLAVLEARVADDKRLGIPEGSGRRRPWGEFTEEEKYNRIKAQVHELRLEPEAAAFQILGREVDLARLPDEVRREFEEGRAGDELLEGVRPALDAGRRLDGVGDREVDLERVPEEDRRKFLGEAAGEGCDGGAAVGAPRSGEYQVWHDRGWPQSRIDQMLGGAPPARFPEDYFHAADVQAGSLEEAVGLTTSTGRALHGDHRPWDGNRGVRSYTPKPLVPRDTDAGDVIVDPRGIAHRFDGRGFAAIETAAEPPFPPAAADRERQALAAYDAEVAEMTRDGPGGESGLARAWRAASERGRLGLLAQLALDHGAEKEVFARTARRVMGWREPTAAQREAMADAWAYAEGVGLPSPEALGTLHAEWRRDGALRSMPDFRADAYESLMTRLEGFGDEFVRLAQTEEQRALAGQFGAFVGEANDTIAYLAGPHAAAGPGRLPSPGDIAAGHDGTAAVPAPGRGDDQGRPVRDYARALLDRFRGAAGRIFAREALPPPSPGDLAERDVQAPAPGPGRGKGRGR